MAHFLPFLLAFLLLAAGTCEGRQAACKASEAPRLYYASRPAAGTLFMVRCYTEAPPCEAGRRVERAFAAINRWEMILSERDARSELARLNEAPWGTEIAVSPELEWALRLSLSLASETQGRFDPTLGPLVRLWRRAAHTGNPPSEADIQKARAASGWRKLTVAPGRVVKTVPGMRLDLGGIGKGIMLDKMAACLREQGITRFLLSDTSDVLAGDPPPGRTGWSCRVGGKEILLCREALSTSGGDYAHASIGGVERTHIIDPETGGGQPPAPAASVRARTAAEADARATAAFGAQENGKKVKKGLHPAGKCLECPRNRESIGSLETKRM